MPNASDLADLAEVNNRILEELYAGFALIKFETEAAIASADRLIMLNTLKNTLWNVEHYQRLARGWPEKR